MRTFIVFSAAAFIATPLTAAAQASPDLVFCSKMASPRERIACYDAAARIASVGKTTTRAVAAPIITREVADYPVNMAPMAKNPFQGAFAAIGGSYGFSNPRSANLATVGFGFSDMLSAKGWSGRAAVGYNATLGNFLFGAELAGRFGSETASVSTVSTGSTFFTGNGVAFSDYQIKNDAGLHVAGRIGMTFDQTLVFMRGGVGASHISERASFDARNFSSCTNFFNGVCTAFQSGILSTGAKSNWIPSAIIGAGIEQNFGAFFVRAEGEIEAVALHQTLLGGAGNAGTAAEPYWFARVMASVGVRF
jgi:hypothetical protein